MFEAFAARFDHEVIQSEYPLEASDPQKWDEDTIKSISVLLEADLYDLAQKIDGTLVVFAALRDSCQLANMLLHLRVQVLPVVFLHVVKDGLHAGARVTDTTLLHEGHSNKLLGAPNVGVARHFFVLRDLDHVHALNQRIQLL